MLGTYRVHYTLRTGTCPSALETVVVVTSQTQPPQGCTGTTSVTEDHCSATLDVTCPEGQGGTLQMTGQLTTVTDASSATGPMALVSRYSGGTVACQGSYDVTYTRL